MITPLDIDLPSFLEDWLGPADLPKSMLPDELAWIPIPLREWHETSSRWSKPVMRLKRMVKPQEIKAENGKAVFLKDPTGDWLWSFDTANPTQVYEAELYGDWMRSAEDLPEFIVHSALNESVFNGKVWRHSSNVSPDRLDDVLAPLTEVSFRGWRWPEPGVRVFMGDGLLAEVTPIQADQDELAASLGHVEIQLATNCHNGLDYLERFPEIRWIGPPADKQ